MVHIDLGDFTLNVPLKHRMTIKEFLTVADRVEGLQPSAQQRPVYEEQPPARAPPPSSPKPMSAISVATQQHMDMHEEDFYLEKKDELQTLVQQMRIQNKRLEQHDQLIVQMLEYMQSMTEHMKRT